MFKTVDRCVHNSYNSPAYTGRKSCPIPAHRNISLLK